MHTFSFCYNCTKYGERSIKDGVLIKLGTIVDLKIAALNSLVFRPPYIHRKKNFCQH